MLTVVLHRQWLTVRRAGPAPGTAPQRRTVRCLRDAVLLLHSLAQRDKLFAVHCVGVLHQYDQAVPGVRALIRGLPDVTECEGERAGAPSAPAAAGARPMAGVAEGGGAGRGGAAGLRGAEPLVLAQRLPWTTSARRSPTPRTPTWTVAEVGAWRPQPGLPGQAD